MIKAIKAQLAKLEAAIQAAIIQSVPGFGAQFVAGAIARLPELGGISNKAAAALSGSRPTTTTGASIEGIATSRADGTKSAICSI
jgi:hypothetical protein